MRVYRLSLGILLLLLGWIIAVPSTAAEKAVWESEWERTVKMAKEEGQVTVYCSAGLCALLLEAGIFQKRFPEIKVRPVVGDMVQRILAERRAGKYHADVTIGGSTLIYQLHLARALDPIKDALILPEVLDESKWWSGKHRYTDPDRSYVFVFVGTPQAGGIFYNTKLVNPKEFQSFWDFVNPKWKGKIASNDFRGGGPGASAMRVFYYNPKLGPPFIRRLFSEMEVVLFRDWRQGVDWLATGKFPICFFCSGREVGIAKRQGLPVDGFGFMKEGVGLASSNGNISLLNRSPHPNAAKVFINWLLSKEGQLTVQREFAKAETNPNSLRMDIPKDMIPPEERLVEGVDYIVVDTPERMDMKPMLKVVDEALAQAKR